MTKNPGPGPSLSTADIDIIEASFRCVTDATAFDDMVVAWDRRLSKHQGGYISEAADQALSQRLSVVNDLMARFSVEPSDEDRIQQAVSQVNAAAFVMSANGGIIAANMQAETWFGVRRGGQLADDWMDSAAKAELDGVRRSCTAAGNRQHAILRVEGPNAETALAEAYVLQIPDRSEGLVVVRILELAWHGTVSQQLAEAFGLTAAEIDIARLLLTHRDTARIAEVRGSTVLTVRTQLRAIFSKTETATQVDLVRLLSMLCARAERSQHGAVSHWQDPLGREQHFIDPDGRRIAYSWMGAADGVPAILVHAAAVGFLLPHAAQMILAERGIRLYTICRPGFGNSDPAPDLDPVDAGARAIAALQAHLGIARCLGVAFSSAIIPLLRYAAHAPAGMPHLLGIGGCMPLVNIDHLPLVQRTLFNLARHAPWAAQLYARAGYHVMRVRGAEWYLRRVYAESPVDLAVLDQPDALPLLRSTGDMQFAQGVDSVGEEIRLLLARWEGDLLADGPKITMLHGVDDRFYATDQLLKFAASHPALDVELVERAGDLIAFQHPALIAERIAKLAMETA